MRILCTGNPTRGITYQLSTILPDIDFISRSNGYDLTTIEGIDKFKEIISNYNIFINHSQLIPGVQCELLTIAHESWDYGQVINIGSILELEEWAWYDTETHIDKNKLKKLSINLNSERFKSTHLTVGGLAKDNTNDNQRLSSLQVANVIKYIIDSNIHIPLMQIENTNDELIRHYQHIKNQRK